MIPRINASTVAFVPWASATCSNCGVPTGGSPLWALPAKPVSSAENPPTIAQAPSSNPIQTRVVTSLVHSARTSRVIGGPPSGLWSARRRRTVPGRRELEVDLLEPAGLRAQLVQFDPGREGTPP